jgi:hypothetical protein
MLPTFKKSWSLNKAFEKCEIKFVEAQKGVRTITGKEPGPYI